MPKLLLFANTDWFLYNFRLASARAARERGYEVVLVSPEGRYAPKLQQLGFRWVHFPLERRGTHPLSELNTILRLTSLYRNEKPDLVHHFTVKCVLYGTLAARLSGVKSIVNSLTGLGYIFTGKRNFLRVPISLAYRFLLQGTWTIFENPDDREFFIQRGWTSPAQSTTILGAGVDVDLFKPTPEPEGIPLVIFPARILWDKGAGEFVKAAKILREKNVQAKFVLVGESDPGNPSGVPLETIQAWTNSGTVEWWGWQEDMPAIYSRASIVCLPSYREGLPKTLIEAAACGRAIVTTDVPGCREVVIHGENGFLVPPQDSAALADALGALISNPSLRDTMGAYSREHTLKHFSMLKITEETLGYYWKVISSQPAQR